MTVTDYFADQWRYIEEAHRQSRVGCMGVACGSCGAIEHAQPDTLHVLCWRCASRNTTTEIHFHTVT